MAGIKIDPEMLDIYMESLNKLMAGSETDGGNARLEVSGAGKTEDGLVRYNEEVNKLGDDLMELYGNVGEILGRIRDGTLFKNADKVSVVARSTDGAGVLAKHADEAAAWQHGGKVFRYSDETAEAVASGEKLLKESGTIYESFADMMSPENAKRYLDFLERWKQRRIDRCRAGRSGNGRYNMEVLQEDRIMYRAGNVQNPYGRWFTSEDIMLCKLI